jgi:hypothetical protein
MSSESENRSAHHPIPTRRPWESMTLTYVGRIAEVVQAGEKKLSRTGGDPGDPRKPRGQG